jgi:hypothetical protein
MGLVDLRRWATEPELADEISVEHVHEQLLQVLEALLHPHSTVDQATEI